jgi:hypothetical protein
MPSSAYFSTFTRAWELATGALLALAAPRLIRLGRPVRYVLGTAGLLAIGVAAVVITPDMGFPGVVALLPVLGTAAVVAAGTAGEALGPVRMITVRPVTWVGDVSYSLYLWHWPALVLGATYAGKRQSPLETAVLVGATVIASAISYYAIENPIRRARGPLLSGRRGVVLWPVALGLTLAAALGSGTYVDRQFAALERSGSHVDLSGLPRDQRVARTGDPIHDALAESVEEARANAPIPFPLKTDLQGLAADYWHIKTGCTARHLETEQSLCSLGDPGGRTTVVVFGDSHAKMWMPALNRYVKARHVRMIPLVKLGCAPYEIPPDGTPFGQSCAAYRSWALDQIRAIRPDLVLVSAESPKVDATSDNVRMWQQAVEGLVARLDPLTPRIRVIGDVSQQKLLPPECLSSRSSTMATCTARVSRRIVAFDRAASKAASAQGVPYVDVLDLVCVEGLCPMVADGIPIFRDQNHVTRTWAAHVSDEFVARLRIGGLSSAS